MALKDLLVCVDQTEAAPARLRLAADLARRHESRLAALFVWEFNQAQLDMRKKAELGLASGGDLGRLNRRIQSSIDQAADRLRSQFEALGREHRLEIEWRCEDGPTAVVAPQQARYADLCIVGSDEPEDGASIGYTFSEQLLFVIGRPLVFIPSFGSFETLGRRIVIGWNASRPATRAVSNALPLIERAERTTVITIDSADFADWDGAPAADQLVQHLRRHNPAVDALHLKDVAAGAIAKTLLTQASALGADLIVTGAYGHPKFWEKMVGGVTHDLIDRMNFPILMSH
jgi:nucleotide-binding universal stress UspA family protein